MAPSNQLLDSGTGFQPVYSQDNRRQGTAMAPNSQINQLLNCGTGFQPVYN